MKSLLAYSPETGEFKWLVCRSRKSQVGSVAGNLNQKGYVIIGISGRTYQAHRLAFLFMEGFFPESQVDHIDGNRSNNRFSNLRKCSPKENNENRKIPCNNTSGYLGVSKSGRGWRARIKHDRIYLNLGTFDSKEEAYQAYLKKKSEIHLFNPTPRADQ